mgnify:CR=1 FL=1
MSITGDLIIQPFIKNNIIVLFNGEIYNYKELTENDYKSDGECIIDSYLKYGNECFKKFDGEFAIVLFDFNKDIFILSSDVFATKPLFYAIQDKKFAIASYKSSIKELGLKNIIKLQANVFKIFSLKDLSLLKMETLFKFNLKQYKSNFDDWNSAFENSILKRSKNLKYPLFVCLSSGYDSGAICCALNNLKIDYSTYTIIGNENIDVLNERIKKNNKEFKIFDVSDSDYDLLASSIKNNAESLTYNYKNRDIFANNKLYADGAAIGNLKLFKSALDNGCKIFLSGSGADEIISDYSIDGEKIFEHSCFKGIFPSNLKDIFPKTSRADENCIWKSFYEGTQENYLMKEEIISGLVGIEGRYPFLDKYVVQEFLSLDCKLKNSEYKSVIDNYLTIHDYPYEKKKKLGYSLNNSKHLKTLERTRIKDHHKKEARFIQLSKYM